MESKPCTLSLRETRALIHCEKRVEDASAYKNKFSLGVTLVEFLIASTLGLLIISAVVWSYTSSKKSYRFQTEFWQLYERAAIAEYILTQAIHQAGYFGCAQLSKDTLVFNHLKSKDLVFQKDYFLQGWLKRARRFLPDAKLPSAIIRHSTDKSDVIKLQNMAKKTAVMIKNLNDEKRLIISNKPIYSAGQWLAAADCHTIELFCPLQIKQELLKEQQVLITKEKLNNFKVPTQIARFKQSYFYIAKTQRKTPAGQPIFALYQLESQNRTSELIEGIEKMHIYYIDHQGEERRADQVVHWHQIQAIHIKLLMHSLKPVTDSYQLYDFDQRSYTAADFLLRAEWNFIVSLKNKHG